MDKWHTGHWVGGAAPQGRDKSLSGSNRYQETQGDHVPLPHGSAVFCTKAHGSYC